MQHKLAAWLLTGALSLSATVGTMSAVPTAAATASGNYTMEYLDRGISAINTGSGMLVSWRYLANDSDSAVFKLYRDNTLIYTSNAGDATCYLDASGSASSTYRVDTVENGTVTGSSTCSLISDQSYLELPLDPPTSSDCTYSPNDCSVGDVDGDGVYEIFMKWDPSNSKDNSQKGKTGNVYIDCYRLDGTRLWRIDLGVNIRAGAHYTQFYVADFDLDGKAEMTCKTADGTVDGQGTVIGDASKDYRNSSGYVLSGPEYYTLFDGATGAALDTVDYEPARGTVSKWGDKYGNRVDRFWGTVAYLDGEKPSVVTGRGYYTRLTATAYDVVNKKLVKRWSFDTGNSSSATGYGDGNHNSMAADVDGDGKQEIITGATCLDDDGTVLWCTNAGHGDALHLGDFLPERDGLELWVCHEVSPYGVTLIDASNGKTIFHKDGSSDTGRCCADNVWSGNDGAEFWGLGNDVYDGSGNTLSCNRPAINFLSYWDGDLEREILDGYTDSPATIKKMGENGKLTNLLTTDGYYTCNTTKGTPCLSADIFGDWREELIVRAADSKSIRIYCTPYDTDYRITTLMHDPQYRVQVSAQNTAYNQPPHASFYLGSDEPLPDRPGVKVLGQTSPTPTPTPTPTPSTPTAATLPGVSFMLKNVNSGLYMEVANGTAAAGTNIQQWGADGSSVHNTWRAISAGDGYYYLYSLVGDQITYLADISGGKADNGTNVAIWTKSSREYAQQFLFDQNEDGSYTIYTKASDLKSCVEVADASTASGANVQEYEYNGNDCQHWILETVTDTGVTMDTSKSYQFQNLNSGLLLEVKDANASAGADVQQWENNDNDCQKWTLAEVGSGYYYIYSQLGDGKTYYLDVADGKAADGTNVQIFTATNTSAQLFKFIPNPDGTYTIVTKASKDKSAVGIADASTEYGASAIQWTRNGSADQKWTVIASDIVVPVTTTEAPATTTAPPETTTVTTITTVATLPETTATQAPATTAAPVTTVVTTKQPVVTTVTATVPIPVETSTVSHTDSTAASQSTTAASSTATSTQMLPPVTGNTTAETSGKTAATTTIEPSNLLYGDVNLNGKVDLSDAVLLSKALADVVELSDAAKTNADCLEDDTLNGNDCIILLQFLVGILDKLPQLPE